MCWSTKIKTVEFSLIINQWTFLLFQSASCFMKGRNFRRGRKSRTNSKSKTGPKVTTFHETVLHAKVFSSKNNYLIKKYRLKHIPKHVDMFTLRIASFCSITCWSGHKTIRCTTSEIWISLPGGRDDKQQKVKQSQPWSHIYPRIVELQHWFYKSHVLVKLTKNK